MRFTATRTELPVDVAPDFPQETGNAAEASEIRQVAEARQALLEKGAEGGVGGADGSADEVDPDEASIVSHGARWNEFEDLRELCDETDAAGLARCEPWDEAAQVDASS